MSVIVCGCYYPDYHHRIYDALVITSQDSGRREETAHILDDSTLGEAEKSLFMVMRIK